MSRTKEHHSTEATLRIRIEALCALLRMHRCLADSAMSVEKCVDGGWCGCSAGLLLQEPRP